MGRLDGRVSITGLPPHRGLIIHLCFFAAGGPNSPVPYDGAPPAEAATDCDKLFEQVDLKTESLQPTFEHDFVAERPPGHYFVQVRAILFRSGEGRMIAQAEQFFFAQRPVRIPSEPSGQVHFPVAWPAVPLDALQHYGTISPRKRPWWRFW